MKHLWIQNNDANHLLASGLVRCQGVSLADDCSDLLFQGGNSGNMSHLIMSLIG